MEARPLRTILDAERGRRIRNTYYPYMTGDPRPISVLRQIRWWYRTYLPARERGEKIGWLFSWRVCGRGRAVGYGGLSWEDGRWWLTAGLVPEARGRGLGREMFEFLTREALRRDLLCRTRLPEAWLRVYAFNAPARRLYESLGYEYVRESLNPDLTMVRRG